MKISEILIKAKALIATPETWTQGTYARRADGVPARTSLDVKAVCWCSIGAVEKTLGPGIVTETWREALAALSFITGDSVASFNDSQSHETVMEAWDRAIQRQLFLEAKNEPA